MQKNSLFLLFIFEIQLILESHDKTGYSCFWPGPPENTEMNLYQHTKNQFTPSVHSSDTASFRVLSPDWPHLFFWPCLPQIFLNHLLLCENLYQHAKKQIILSVHTWDTVNLRVHRPEWPHPFFTTPTQKSLNRILAFLNLCQHAKIQSIPFIHSWETISFRVPWPG